MKATNVWIARRLRSALRCAGRYIDRHHETYGCALFVIPALLLPLILIAIVQGLVTLFG